MSVIQFIAGYLGCLALVWVVVMCLTVVGSVVGQLLRRNRRTGSRLPRWFWCNLFALLLLAGLAGCTTAPRRADWLPTSADASIPHVEVIKGKPPMPPEVRREVERELQRLNRLRNMRAGRCWA